MKYFKDNSGKVYAYESDGSQDDFISDGLIAITKSEAMDIANGKFTTKQIIENKIAIVQKHMDDAARALNYDDIKTAVTYAEEPAVPKFQNEGRVFREWRSLVWEKCYTILADVEAGNRVIPTDDELIAELPKINL